MTSAELSFARGDDPQLWHRARTPERRRQLYVLERDRRMAALGALVAELGRTLGTFGRSPVARPPEHTA